MSERTIIYNELDDLASRAGKAKTGMRTCADNLQRLVINKLKDVPGEDTVGHVMTATTLALQKAQLLREKSDVFQTFASDVTQLEEEAEDSDKRASSAINSIAESLLGKQSILSKAVSAVINFVCVDLPNWIEDSGWLGEFFIGTLRKGANALKHLIEDVKDWFKYGNGQYLLEILKAVAEVGLVVLSIIGLTLTGSVLLALIAIVAGGIWLLCTFGNMMATVENNITAILNSDSPGLARYYSQNTGVKGYIDSHDFGDIEDNYRADVAGRTYDVVNKTAKTVYKVATLALSVDALGNVYGMDGKTVVDHDYSLTNMKRNFSRNVYSARREAGYTYNYSADSPYEAQQGYSVLEYVKNTLFKPSSLDGKSRGVKAFTVAVGGIDSMVNGNENIATIKDFFADPGSYFNGEDGNHVPKVFQAFISFMDKTPLQSFKSTYIDPIIDPIENAYDIIAVG